MKFAVCVVALAVVVGSCKNASPHQRGTYSSEAAKPEDDSASLVRDYSISDNQHIILVIQKEGMSDADVKNLARQKAAEVTIDEGFCYYMVEKEENVKVMASEKSPFYNQQNPPPDLYEQHIQRKDLRRNGIVDFTPDGAQPYPGYRMTIRLYKTSPSFRAVKVCE